MFTSLKERFWPSGAFSEAPHQEIAPRIFVGTSDISGNYSTLCEGFRNLGMPVTFVVDTQHPFGYEEVDTIPKGRVRFEKILRVILSLPIPIGWQTPLHRLTVLTKLVFSFPTRFRWAVRMIVNHDVFIFGFGSSLLPGNIDLPILFCLHKKYVISNLEHGSEARPPVADGAWRKEMDSIVPARELRILTRRTRLRVARHERFANVVIGNPLSSGYFAKNAMINAYFVGRPLRRVGATPLSNGCDSSKKRLLRLAHIPSHAACKGTAEIEQTIENLRSEGFEFEFVSISNVSNKRVLEVLTEVDLLLDQVYSDRYWSKTAAEAAVLGKPTLVAGYGFDLLDTVVPPNLRPPVFSCRPEELEAMLGTILSHPESLKKMGLRAQFFAQTIYKADQVAQRYLTLTKRRQIPERWLFDPTNVHYFWGCGQNAKVTISNYRSLWEAHGTNALQLEHKQASLQKIRQRFALFPK